MQKWEPPPRGWVKLNTPPRGWVKLNTDAAFCHETGAAGTGIIIRDAEGSVLLAAWRALRGCGSPEQAEAEACLEGLRLTAEWIRQPTWVETDCQNLVNDIQRPSNARSRLAGILAEIQAMRNILPECNFRHVRRGSNEVAHGLARRDSIHQECVVMRLNAPSFVRELIQRGAAGSPDPSFACNRVVP
jgi:ribonuclease HI